MIRFRWESTAGEAQLDIDVLGQQDFPLSFEKVKTPQRPRAIGMGFGNWRPQTIRRFVRGFPTSARTALVETDVGLGYLKAMGGPEGPHTLAAEVVGTQLAEWFGLPTFECAIIVVDQLDEIPFLDREGNPIGQAVSGPAFIAKAELGSTWSGGARELKRLANPDDISRLVVFDTWVLNCDRHSWPQRNQTGKPRVNRDNVFFSEDAPKGLLRLKAMDHTHCFTCGREWTRRLSQVDIIRDRRIFGLFPEFRKFLKREVVRETISDLNAIKAETVKNMLQAIPREWDVPRKAIDALVDLVVGRAKFLSGTIEAQLWPQRQQTQLFPDDSEGNAQK